MNLKFLRIKLKQIKLSMIWVEKQLKYLVYLLKIFEKNTNIWLVKISDTDQVCLKKLNLSILHWVQLYLIVLKRKQIQIRWIQKKTRKNLIYNSQHSFTKFRDIDEFKELSLDSVHKKLNDFLKKLISFKLLIHKQMKIKSWSQKF